MHETVHCSLNAMSERECSIQAVSFCFNLRPNSLVGDHLDPIVVVDQIDDLLNFTLKDFFLSCKSEQVLSTLFQLIVY